MQRGKQQSAMVFPSRPGAGDENGKREMRMISIEEITLDGIREFWDLHIRYLTEDGIISDEEDIACPTAST